MAWYEASAQAPACGNARQSATRLALLGPGRVGQALLRRFQRRADRLQLVAIANSTQMLLGTDLNAADWEASARTGRITADLDQLVNRLASGNSGRSIVIDATASTEVAALHAEWLERGLAVVTANKWALAAPLSRWRALDRQCWRQPLHYQAAATVGAGLPLISSIERLRQSGETISALGGVLSGSMNFICRQVRAGAAPSTALIEAAQAGFTEPDPRHDLDGLDVARKLVILARAAGYPLSLEDVEVASLVPPALRAQTRDGFLSAADQLDDHWQQCAANAPGRGEVLVHAGRFDPERGARVGLERVTEDDALASLAGSANLVEIRSDCYSDQGLIIAGPGAGVEVTALALWADLAKLTNAGNSSAEVEQAMSSRQQLRRALVCG